MSLTRREALATLGAAVLTGSSQAAPSTVRLSTFQVEVTPPMGHPCMGGGIAPVARVEDPLFALGFAILGAGKPLVYVAVDWCEIRNNAYDRWRDAIAEAVGTDRVRVLVSALHQHDAPIADLAAQRLLDEHRAKGAICMLEFHEKTVQRVAAAVKSSLTLAVPVTHVGVGQAEVKQVASNRRYLDEAGKVRYDRMSATRDAKIRAGEVGTIDPFVRTLSFWNGETPLVGLSAYSTHPMSYYGRGGVSADFVGIARRLLQHETPKTLQIYASGCSGNVTAGKYNDGAAENRPILGQRLADAMLAAWRSTKKHPVGDVAFRNVPFHLEPRGGSGFSEADLLKRLKTESRPFSQCLAALGLSWRRRCEAGQPIDLPVIDFGPAQLAVLPAEAYVEFQLFAQKVRPDVFTVVAGYGESGPGYIPIERAWREGDGNLHDWCWVAPGSEQRMNDAITMALKG